jgi:6-phosphogluconolactonase (cycloisomerase 2 family)
MRFSLLAVVAGAVTLLAPGGADAQTIYIPNHGDSSVSTFDLGATGALSPVGGSPFNVGGSPVAMAATPDGTRSVTSDLLTPFTIHSQTIAPGGALTPADVKVTGANGPQEVAITPDGKFVYVTHQNPPGGIKVFSIGADGSLTSASGLIFSAVEGGSIAITPDGRYLFQTGSGPFAIYRLAIQSNGALNALGPSVSLSAKPYHLVTTPDGKYLIVNKDDNSVESFAIGDGGSLTSTGAPLNFGGFSSGVPVLSTDGRFYFYPDVNADAIRRIAVGSDGSLTSLGATPMVGAKVAGVSSDGKFLLAGKSNNDEFSVFSISQAGDLSAVSGPVDTAGGEAVRPIPRPGQAPVAKFSSTPGETGQPTKFDASASTDVYGKVAHYDWSFGDGTSLADGGPTPSHAYSNAGAYDIGLTVTNDQGCSTKFVYTGQTTYCNGGPSATTTGKTDTLPTISGLSLTNKKFAVAARKRAKLKRGSAFRYTLSENATVKFTIERKTSGRKSGKKCVKKTKKNRSKKKCTLFKGAGSLSAAGKAGKNTTRFSGKVKSKKLKPGSYRATAVATDSAKGQSAAKTVSFKIVRG